MSQAFQLPISIEQLRESDYQTQVATLCDAFEETWNQGVHPSVAEFASLASPTHRKQILRELILTERECFEFLPPLASYRDPLSVAEKPSIAQEQTVRSSADETLTPSPSEPETALPSHIDRYAITRLLGTGSFGTVYEAEDVEIRRRVAIKVAKKTNLSEQPFAREAANVGSIDHPAIVPVLDIGQWRGVHYMVSELVEGENLKQYCQTHDVDPLQSVSILIELADAIAAAHACGIIHRDLKPANIVIQKRVAHEEGLEHREPQPINRQLTARVRVLDFGIAKNIGRSTMVTVAGDIVGTPHYMSPEQARGDSANVDKRSDLFSLGIILFELLCKRLPFEGPPMVVIAAIRDLDAMSVRSIKHDISQGLDAIVSKCLQRDLASRYASAAELARDLRLWRDGHQPTVLTVRTRKRQRHFALVAILLVTTLCGIVFGLNAIQSGKPNALLDSSSVAINSGESRIPRISSEGLEQWIQQGQLHGLNDWLDSYQRHDPTAYSEWDAARLVSLGDPNHRKRRQFVHACLQAEAAVSSDGQSALVHAKTLFPLHLASFSRFVQLAPVWVLEHYSKVERADLAGPMQCAISGELSNRWSRAGQFELFMELLRRAESSEVATIIDAILPQADFKEEWQSQVLQELAEIRYEPSLDKLEIESIAQWKAKLTFIAYRLGRTDVSDQILDFNPLPQARSYFIYWLSSSKLDLSPLLEKLPSYLDDWRASGVVLCLMNRFERQQSNDSMPPQSDMPQEQLRDLFRDLYAKHPSATVHQHARTMLAKLGDTEYAESVDQLPSSRMIESNRNWYTNPMGMSMSIVRGPTTFWFGPAPTKEKLPTYQNPGRWHTIQDSFAYSSDLVSEKLYNHFDETKFVDPQDRCMVDASWTNAVQFCDWMSRQEGLIETDSLVGKGPSSWSYHRPEFGYRLMSVWEWECFARSGTISSFQYGENSTDLATTSMFSSDAPKYMEWTESPCDNIMDPSRIKFELDSLRLLYLRGWKNEGKATLGLPSPLSSKFKRTGPVCFRVFRPIPEVKYAR